MIFCCYEEGCWGDLVVGEEGLEGEGLDCR